MAHIEEGSDIKSSGSNVKNIITSKLFNSLTYNDKLKEQIIAGIIHLQDTKKIPNLKAKKENIYENLYCIDGSFANLPGLAEVISLRVGSAVLDTSQLLNIERDRFGTPNPHKIAQLFQNPKNVYLDNAFPSKNSYIFENNRFYSMRESFEMALVDFFSNGLAKEIKDKFFLETKNEFNLSTKDSIIKLPAIENLLQGIREESIVFSTQQEVQKIMLMMESMLSQYMLYQSSIENEKGIIVLDGRLQNEELGKVLRSLNETKIQTVDTMLMGVQKTGRLNLLLSKMHEIIKCEDLGNELKNLKDKYINNESLLFILDNKFKKICGLPDSGNGNYGVDCLYISEGPSRQEFVFTLPIHIFESNKFQGKQTHLFGSLVSLFEFAHTDLYFKNKGVLLTNVLAHSNVSLNIKYTNVITERIESKNQTLIKKKL